MAVSAETRARLSAAQKGKPKSLEHRAALARSMKANREHIEKSAARLRAWNLSPEGQATIRKNLEKVHQEWARGTGNQENLARIHASWLKAPRGVKNSRRFFKSIGLWAVVGEFLRKRDGDLCQLCLEHIDFEIPLRTPRSRSVDHIVPARAGGTDETENLWLAHLVCNQRKGARYVGRKDGSIDVRS